MITQLGVGGAENMLLKLASLMDRSQFDTRVLRMIARGPLVKKFEALGVPVQDLGMRQGVPDPLAILRMARALREWRPDVVQTWMYHADLLGGVVGALVTGVPIVWGIRHSNLEPELNKGMTLRTARLCARLSPMRISVTRKKRWL